MGRRYVTVGEHALGHGGLALLRLHRSGDATAAEVVVSEMSDLLGRLHEPDLARDLRRDPVGVVDGYGRWAPLYDRPGNPVVANEQPIVWELLDDAGGEPVLDAACGTGRHVAHLVQRGIKTIGVDISEEMLAVARNKVVGAEFRWGEILELPVDDDTMAGVVCALALEHVEELDTAYREFARVVRHGGWVITSSVHPAIALIGWQAWFADESGRTDIVTHNHSVSDHIRAAHAAGLQLVDCLEPCIGADDTQFAAPPLAPIGGPIAVEGFPVVLVLKFAQLLAPAT